MDEKMKQEQHVGPGEDNCEHRDIPMNRTPIKRTVSKVNERTASKGETPRRF